MLVQDFFLALTFFTRLPIGKNRDFSGRTLAQAAWAFPLVGIVVGLGAAILYAIALKLGLSYSVAAWVALGGQVLLTGGLHEDGLADTADGLAAGRSKDEKLAIMRDSRIGSYGVIALVIVLALRASAIAGLEDHAVWALIAAGACSRASIVWLMHRLPNAREDGLASIAGRPSAKQIAVATFIGVVTLLLSGHMLEGIASLVLVSAVCSYVAQKQFGGITGDVLGATQQLAEVAVLLTS